MSTNRLDRNVVVLGSAGVGKSSAILRFQRNEYGDDYYPTVTNTYNKRITVNDKEYNLTITDTAGQDETTLLDSTYVGSMDVYVIAFSLVFRRSFEVAKVIRDKILELTGTESAGIVLVGNKSDLYDQREVSTTEAQELAKKFGCPYIETSAKKNINIDELFAKSVRVANKARGGSSDEVEGDTTDKSTCVIM